LREIGHTDHGCHIVELTKGEYDTFVDLAELLAGRPTVFFRSSGYRRLGKTEDMDNAFKAIRAWILGSGYVLEMRRYLDSIDAAFDPEKGKSKIIKAAP
jgi:hypothetical protein